MSFIHYSICHLCLLASLLACLFVPFSWPVTPGSKSRRSCPRSKNMLWKWVELRGGDSRGRSDVRMDRSSSSWDRRRVFLECNFCLQLKVNVRKKRTILSFTKTKWKKSCETTKSSWPKIHMDFPGLAYVHYFVEVSYDLTGNKLKQKLLMR